MKKIIFTLSLLLLLSCSHESEREGVIPTPSWIQGSWKNINTNEVLKFTQKDIILNNSYSFSDQPKGLTFANVNIITNTSTSYVVEVYNVKGGVPVRFIFRKTSETTMDSKGYLPGRYFKIISNK